MANKIVKSPLCYTKTTEANFAVLSDILRLLSRVEFPWFIAGGYAIDLFLGRITRLHSDIDMFSDLERPSYLNSLITVRINKSGVT